MRKLGVLALVFEMFFNLSPAWAGPTAVEGEILVRFGAGAPPEAQRELEERLSLRYQGEIAPIRVRILRHGARTPAQAVEALRSSGLVEFAEPNYVAEAAEVVPSDPWWPSQWSPVKTRMPAAWDLAIGSSSVAIAILDTGIDHAQPDLQGSLVSGRDFVNGDDDPSDDHGHGTMVTGVAAARGGNDIGGAGHCWGCSIMPVKVLGADGRGSVSNIASGIVWAVDRGARVINLSLGLTTDSATLSSAVSYAYDKGAVLVAAAGNSGSTTKNYPAAYEKVIGVAGTDGNDTKYSWSNYGSWVKLAAPGSNVTTGRNAWYGSFAGTSSASPVVAGIAGLALSRTGGAGAREVESALLGASVPVGGIVRYGRVDGYGTLSRLSGGDSTPPTAQITSPAEGATLSGQVMLAASATDDVGVSSVSFAVNGATVATTDAPPYQASWDTATVPDGNYDVGVRAVDAAGNATTATVRVTVANSTAPQPPVDTTAPSVRIVSPTEGAQVSGTVTIATEAQDDVGVAKVELYVDGALKATSTKLPFSFRLNVKPLAPGWHALSCKAYDAAGNAGTSASVSVRK